MIIHHIKMNPIGAGFEHGEEDVVFGDRIGLLDRDDALAVEVVGDAAGVGHGAAISGHRHAHVGGGAVAVVREAFDEHGYAAGVPVPAEYGLGNALLLSATELASDGNIAAFVQALTHVKNEGKA